RGRLERSLGLRPSFPGPRGTPPGLQSGARGRSSLGDARPGPTDAWANRLLESSPHAHTRPGQFRSAMSHLHIPDGILPPQFWVSGLVVTALLLFWSSSANRPSGPRELAFQSSLGGIMLA